MGKIKLYTTGQVRVHKELLNRHEKLPAIVRDFRRHWHHECETSDPDCRLFRESVRTRGKRYAEKKWAKLKREAGLFGKKR